ncbi:hypothetical protein [Burkholderia sp. Ac-20379]|uniref:hypothetical protein n=1 Tax=Burkholderia sp. Ac-20379 TaxID=2703900 RepID=UPI00197F5628|nr:hypothetical protein [Burkholderia sp. Ac-20379]MBN3726024.1 hypothetical protein [Burkholderia sp. Ac-20379]
MNWKSKLWSDTAEHLESGTKFSIKYRSNRVKGIDDIDIAPIGRNDNRWSSEALLHLKNDLWDHWQHQIRRDKLSSIVRDKFFGECDRVAVAISNVSGKKVSNRSVQSWIIDVDKPSSRTCPPWAIKALSEYVEDPKNSSTLEWLQSKKEDDFRRTRSTLDLTYNRSVEFATREIEDENRILDSWKKASLTELPEKIANTFLRLERETSASSKVISIILNAIETSENLETLKDKVRTELRETHWSDNEVRRTRMAIENGTEEFSSPEGLAD